MKMKISPVQIPAMVAAHVDYLQSAAYRTYATGFIKSRWEQKEESYAVGKQWCDAERQSMQMARLFHVTESMFAVARTMSEKLGAEERWNLDSLPSPYGVLVFEKSVHVLDVWNAQTSYAVCTWSRTDTEKGEPGTLFNFYTDTQDMTDFYNVIMTENGSAGYDCGRWLWDHSVFIPDGRLVSHYTDQMKEADAAAYRRTHANEYVLHEQIAASIRSDHPFKNGGDVVKALYAVFTLMGETRMVSTDELTDKKLARRNAHKKNRPSAMVTVIQLRRQEHYGYHEEGTGTWLTYRSWTAAHRRRVHYGPGGKDVKWIWVSSYLRGSEDLPFHQPHRVNTLSR